MSLFYEIYKGKTNLEDVFKQLVIREERLNYLRETNAPKTISENEEILVKQSEKLVEYFKENYKLEEIYFCIRKKNLGVFSKEYYEKRAKDILGKIKCIENELVDLKLDFNSRS